MVGCISRLPNVSHSLTHIPAPFLSLSPHPLFHSAALLRKLHHGPSVKLRLDCGFLGNSLDFYVHSPNPSHRGIRFLALDVYSTPRVSLPRRYRQAPPSRSSLSFSLSLFIYFPASCLRSGERRDLMLVVQMFSVLPATLRELIARRFAGMHGQHAHIRGQHWYFANRLNALLNNADARQTLCPTNTIIATQYYYISGANVLGC